MDKILITGAAGFIGSHLVEFLLEQKIPLRQLRLLIPENESLKNLPPLRFEIIRGDITDEKDAEKAIEGVDTIYHLAALTIDGGKYYPKSEYDRINVKGTENLLNACRDKKIKRFIFFSSIAVYGLPAWIGDIENWNESQPKNPKEIYGESKFLAEKKIEQANKEWGLPYAIIRPTSVYGPRDKRNLLELYKAIKKHLFFYIGSGRNKMDYVYVKDVARAAYLVSKSKKITGDYIVGGGKPLTLNEVVYYVSKSIGTKVFPLHIPKTIALLVSYLVLWISAILRIKPMLFPNRVKVMTKNCFFNINKAKRELGYQPHFSFGKGTEFTAKWLLENKLI